MADKRRPDPDGDELARLAAELERDADAPRLKPGVPIGLHRNRSGRDVPIRGEVESVEDELFWLAARDAALSPGDLVLIEHARSGDARYVCPVEVEVVSPERVALQVRGGWRRLQQRDHVRIPVEALQAGIARPELAPETLPRDPPREIVIDERGQEHVPVLDLSAGGIRFLGDGSYRVGERLVCHFEIPEVACFVLPAVVVNVERGDRDPDRRWVAARFAQVDLDHESTLIRWIFYEQIRRHSHLRQRRD